MRQISTATLVILAIGASGCATITRGTTEAFMIETEPGGATAVTSLGTMCQPTPCVIPKVSREAEFTVTVSKDGYETATYNVTHQTAGGGAAGMAGNVLVGGIIGAAVDANSGATQELVPNPLRVTMTPVSAVAAAPAAAVTPVSASAGAAEPVAATPEGDPGGS